MLSAQCPYCKHSAPRLFQAQDVNRHITDERFSYYRCPSCHLIFIAPIPDRIEQYYQDEYYTVPHTIEELLPSLEVQRYKTQMILPLVPKGRLLEIGPGTGGFAYLAKEAGYQTEVIEMDRACCVFIETMLGIKAINSADIVSALADQGTYDVVALWQVIEHLPDPWSVLPTLAQHLAPNGILVIAAPNPDSLQFRLFGHRWTHVDAPRHLELIPIPLLEHVLSKYNLFPVVETTTDAGSLGWNMFGWKRSLHNLVRPPRLKRVLRLIGHLLNLGFIPIERSGLRGSTYTLIFQRKAP